MTQTPAGWFPAENGQERYWDGTAWTNQFRPAQAPTPQAPVPQYQQQPPKKSHTLRNVLLVIVLLIVLAVGGCVALIGGAAKSITDQEAKGHDVEYIVGGTAKKGSLTYNTDGSTSISQEADVSLPWTKKLHIDGNLLKVYQISVQNTGTGNGTVTCEIKVDGKSVKTANSSGPGAIASCDYTNGEQ